jgi:hypothetical protein
MSKGVDIPIDALITQLTAGLWTGKNTQFYGRVFRNWIDGKIQPIYYISAEEGIDPLKDDRKDAQCFVDVMPTRKMFADIIEAECRILFMVSLSALYPGISRVESIEQVMQDVTEELMQSQFDIIQMVSGYNAFDDYIWKEDTSTDIGLDHVFRFDLKLTYCNTR